MKYEALIQSSEKLMQHNNEANVKKREMIEYDFYDNLQTNVLQCFVNKGKGKRFFETHQAISYTLQNIIEQCK